MLHGHGGDAASLPYSIQVDFSTNVWPAGQPGGLRQALIDALPQVGVYPPVTAQPLQAALARLHEVPEEAVLVTNGATEAIDLVAQAFRWQTSRIVIPAFAEYEDACRRHGQQVTLAQADQALVSTKWLAGVSWLGNPANPTGQYWSLSEVLAWAVEHPEQVLVVDEAYLPFVAQGESAVQAAAAMPNLLVLRSLTKLYGIPGLRLGYVVAHPTIINKLLEHKLPWTVNALALAAGLHIAAHPLAAGQAVALAHLRTEAQRLSAQLKRLPEMMVLPTATHYLTAHWGGGTAAWLKQQLAQHHGLLIRDASNFRGLSAGHFRVAAQGDPALNNALVAAIAQVLAVPHATHVS